MLAFGGAGLIVDCFAVFGFLGTSRPASVISFLVTSEVASPRPVIRFLIASSDMKPVTPSLLLEVLRPSELYGV